MTTQPTPAAVRELRQFGLTVGDIARMFRVHPKAVRRIIEDGGESDLKYSLKENSHDGRNSDSRKKA